MQVPITSCKYLGYNADTWRPHHDPIQSSNHPRLAKHHEKVKNIQSFSAANFYHRFIYGYPKSQSLTCLTCCIALILWVDMVYNWDSARYYLGSFGPWIRTTPLYVTSHNTTWLCWHLSYSEPVTSPVTPLALVPPRNHQPLKHCYHSFTPTPNIPRIYVLCLNSESSTHAALNITISSLVPVPVPVLSCSCPWPCLT